MSILNEAGIEFDESMSGYIGKGQADPRKGYDVGKSQGADVRFDVQDPNRRPWPFPEDISP